MNENIFNECLDYWLHGNKSIPFWEQEARKAGYKSKEAIRGAFKRERRRKGIINKSKVETSLHGVTIDATENEQEIISKSSRITSLEQLLSYCDVDLDIWLVDHFVVNKWEVGAKGPDKEIVISPLYQVKAWLKRRIPELVTPVVQPVQVNITAFPDKSVSNKVRKNAIILADPHFGYSIDLRTRVLTPFHDRTALSVALQIAKNTNPDLIIWNGDILDLAEWSDKFIRSPEFYFVTQPAIVEAAWWLAQFKQAVPKANHIMLNGNHDDRLDRSIITHLMEAYNLKSADNLQGPAALSLPGLLGLESIGIEYADDEYWITDDIRCIHGNIAKQAPGATAKAINDKANETTIFGHIHRTELTTRTIHNRHGQHTITAFCPGCLCRIDGIVPPGRLENWQQGFASIHYEDAGEPTIDPIRITSGTAYHFGVEYTGSIDVFQIEKDTGWKFQ